jgi:hypothetical protein
VDHPAVPPRQPLQALTRRQPARAQPGDLGLAEKHAPLNPILHEVVAGDPDLFLLALEDTQMPAVRREGEAGQQALPLGGRERQQRHLARQRPVGQLVDRHLVAAQDGQVTPAGAECLAV